jgi:DNA-binding transcriptional ArsR family regulator
MSAASKEPTPDHLLKALAHPMRRRIVRELDGQVASPVQLSTSLKAPLSTVSYHVRALTKYHLLAPAGTRQVRGSLEHFYRLTVDVEWVRTVLAANPEEDEGTAQPPSS